MILLQFSGVYLICESPPSVVYSNKVKTQNVNNNYPLVFLWDAPKFQNHLIPCSSDVVFINAFLIH